MIIQNFHTPRSTEDMRRLLRLLLLDAMPDQVRIDLNDGDLRLMWLDDDGNEVAYTNVVLMHDTERYRYLGTLECQPDDDADQGDDADPIEFSTN